MKKTKKNFSRGGVAVVGGRAWAWCVHFGDGRGAASIRNSIRLAYIHRLTDEYRGSYPLVVTSDIHR
jgi:hypothetical protein